MPVERVKGGQGDQTSFSICFVIQTGKKNLMIPICGSFVFIIQIETGREVVTTLRIISRPCYLKSRSISIFLKQKKVTKFLVEKEKSIPSITYFSFLNCKLFKAIKLDKYIYRFSN